MTVFKKILLASITTLATSASAHADLIISRAVGEANYSVSHCASESDVQCAPAKLLTHQQLKKVGWKLYWLYFEANAARIVSRPAFQTLATPEYMHDGWTTFRHATTQVDLLLHSTEGGHVRVPSNAPGAEFVFKIVDKATGAAPVKPAAPVTVESVPSV